MSNNISSNFFLSDFLSNALQDGFHSASSSIASAILHDGIVLTHTLLTAYTCAMPPSTNNFVPVMQQLSSDARNTTAFAISLRVRASRAEHCWKASSSVARPLLWKNHVIQSGRLDGAWAYFVHANAAMVQVRCPCPRERTHGGFCGAINTIRRHIKKKKERAEGIFSFSRISERFAIIYSLKIDAGSVGCS
jgi:hypothetical protein